MDRDIGLMEVLQVMFFGKKPRGGNNNAIHIHEYDRLSGSTARHGGTARVKISKI